MTIGVKICGINSADAFDAAAAAGADWVGFVFHPPSPRYVTPVMAAAFAAGRPDGPQRVGLFVDPSPAAVAAVLAALPLDALQVYAPAERIAALRQQFALPVWHAVGIGAVADLPEGGSADRWVIEPKPPPGANRPGGNAVCLDLALLRGWRPDRPWLLAGGLTPGTVGSAIRQSGAGAVDVSSGVETAPGVKDPALIRAFVAAARE